jgi:hypothetical protein
MLQKRRPRIWGDTLLMDSAPLTPFPRAIYILLQLPRPYLLRPPIYFVLSLSIHAMYHMTHLDLPLPTPSEPHGIALVISSLLFARLIFFMYPSPPLLLHEILFHSIDVLILHVHQL